MFKLVLKTGRYIITDNLDTVKNTVWIDMIDWVKTDKTQFRGMKIPGWLNMPREAKELI
jgi:hypothetical protein